MENCNIDNIGNGDGDCDCDPLHKVLNSKLKYPQLISLLVERYKDLGVKEECIESAIVRLNNLHTMISHRNSSENGIRILQWNLLARLLADDGFLMNWVIDTTKPRERTSELYNKIKATKIEGDEFLKKLGENYKEDCEMLENDKIMFDHYRRLILIKIYITIYKPDFIVLEECDFVKDIESMLHEDNYTCGMGNISEFKLARDKQIIDPFNESDIYKYLEETCALIAPKIGSTAVKIGIKNKLPENILFDDNVVVFYDITKFNLESIKYKIIPGSITFCAKFINKSTDHKFNIFPVHLPSGDKTSDVIKRQLSCEALMKFVNTVSESESESDYIPYVIVGDFNSRPDEKKIDGIMSAWEILTDNHFISCWTDYYDYSGIRTKEHYPNTTVKCRGPLTAQTPKMGELMTGPIDYIWTYGIKNIKLVSDPQLISDSDDMDVKIDEMIIPSIIEPSDHYLLAIDIVFI